MPPKKKGKNAGRNGASRGAGDTDGMTTRRNTGEGSPGRGTDARGGAGGEIEGGGSPPAAAAGIAAGAYAGKSRTLSAGTSVQHLKCSSSFAAGPSAKNAYESVTTWPLTCCRKGCRERAVHGAHVKIKYSRKAWIIPTCAGCNPPGSSKSFVVNAGTIAVEDTAGSVKDAAASVARGKSKTTKAAKPKAKRRKVAAGSAAGGKSKTTKAAKPKAKRRKVAAGSAAGGKATNRKGK